MFCSLALNCSSCISRPQCAWCSSINISKAKSRCDYYDNLLANGCPDSEVVNPASSVEIVKVNYQDNYIFGIIKPYNLFDQDNVQIDPSESPVQLHPQKIHLHIRKSIEIDFFCFKMSLNIEFLI